MNTRNGFLASVVLVLAACASKPEVVYQVGSDIPRDRSGAEYVFSVFPIHSGSGPEPLDRPARALSAPFPEYSRALRRAGIEGSVRIAFRVKADGTVSDARVEGKVHPALAEISLEAVSKWRFEPLTSGGKPIEATATQEFQFHLVD